MGVIHAPLAGELVQLDPENQNSAAHAFNRPPGTGSAPVRQLGPQTQAAQSGRPQASQAKNHTNRLCLAIWHGAGWAKETVEMLDGFAQFDGQQERSCFILQSPVRGTDKAVILAAQRAFTHVQVVETMFADPNTGIITPYALYDFAGLVPQKLGHRARLFLTMPLKVVGPNSLARLEQEAFQANPGRGKDGKLQGKPVLGAVRTNSKGEKFPFSSFVVLPTWVAEPQFPLIKGLSKFPAKTAQEIPMNFLRYEMMKAMAVSALINPEPDKIPSDPRFVLLEGVTLSADRFAPLALPAPETQEESFAAPEQDFPEEPAFSIARDPSPARRPGAAAIPEFAQMQGLVLPPPPVIEFPEVLELEARISTEGIGWLKDFPCPTDLSIIKLIHNTEIKRLLAAAQGTEIESEPPRAAPSARAAAPAKAVKKKPVSKKQPVDASA